MRDFSKYDTLSFNVFGSSKILIKLEDRNGEQVSVGVRTALKTDDWNLLEFDISNVFNVDKENIKNILFYLAPGDAEVEGSLFIDNIELKPGKTQEKEGAKLISADESKQEAEAKIISINCPYSFSFDKQGNYSIGVTEHIAFPEVQVESAEAVHSLQINIKLKK
ncbi:hypothetical protein KKC59_03585, partial [bacterium]|nr:hypothetical protein [bacterium]